MQNAAIPTLNYTYTPRHKVECCSFLRLQKLSSLLRMGSAITCKRYYRDKRNMSHSPQYRQLAASEKTQSTGEVIHMYRQQVKCRSTVDGHTTCTCITRTTSSFRGEASDFCNYRQAAHISVGNLPLLPRAPLIGFSETHLHQLCTQLVRLTH